MLLQRGIQPFSAVERSCTFQSHISVGSRPGCFAQFTQSGRGARIDLIVLGAVGFSVNRGWTGPRFIRGRSVVACFLFAPALENQSCGQ
ncbi:MAG TPA: hypothetical protein VNY51_13145 [Candidatus Dormibacteraeota bacterium]|nr:hypothetical protein [Candidatus Dormibacteraeota bacterium]